jgi:hypothetical protein
MLDRPLRDGVREDAEVASNPGAGLANFLIMVPGPGVVFAVLGKLAKLMLRSAR